MWPGVLLVPSSGSQDQVKLGRTEWGYVPGMAWHRAESENVPETGSELTGENMTGGWTFGGQPASLGAESVTLVEGSSFCVSDSAGRMASGSAHGVFYLDTRVLSTWQLLVDGEDVEALAVIPRSPHEATFLGRAQPRTASLESTLLVEIERYVGDGMRDDMIIRNVAREPAGVRVTLLADADFADLFAVKEGRVRGGIDRRVRLGDGLLEIEARWDGRGRGVRIEAPGATVASGTLSFREVVPARGEWRTTLLIQPIVDGVAVKPRFPIGQPVEAAAPAVRLLRWRRGSPRVRVADRDLLRTLRRSELDLGALRIFDPEHPDVAAIAAGAPWFMALFGRDSLLTGYMALPIDPQLALGTLQTLARFQGTKYDPLTEEQPGRIVHEMRFGVETTLALGGGAIYYGTADATPLFVVLLGELRRWGLSAEEVDALIPHAERALEWIVTDGDRDGDGFVEYQRQTDRGLRNQGWKDSWDGINFADGAIAEPPIALCEVQGYVYSAFIAGSFFAAGSGNPTSAGLWADRAKQLKQAFNEQFWLPERGWFAVGLDKDKRQIDALTSNIGHCLWSGIVDEDKAAQVVEHLMSTAMFSGWGVRTLASTMGAYNPISYHNGSVWPHDNAIIAAGLMRYGYVEQAHQIIKGILDAASRLGGRLPELLTGLDRTRYPHPVPYPTSCSPQAWAAATPIQFMRTLLRFDPSIPTGRLWLAPALPESFGAVHMENAPLGGSRLSLYAEGDRVEVEGLPAGVELVPEARPTTPELFTVMHRQPSSRS
jgi:glycogen debranching enzyme